MPVFWFKKFDCGTNVYFGLESTLRDGILVDISCWAYCLLIRNTTISLNRTFTFWSISQPAFTCSKLTIKTPKRRQWRRVGVFIVAFEHISHLCSSVSIVNFEHVIAVWDICQEFYMVLLTVCSINWSRHSQILEKAFLDLTLCSFCLSQNLEL